MINLTQSVMKQIFPSAPSAHIAALVNKQSLLSEILQTPQRLALCCANLYAETGGLTIAGLIENINYSADAMARTWPSRFPGGAAQVQDRYGTARGWQEKAFDEIYGNRMGNRPGTSDGSLFIGRGDCQITGRDGYQRMQDMTGIPLVASPSLASSFENQAAIIAAFWKWKGLSRFADRLPNADVVGARRAWNGGSNGLSVVQTQYAKMLKIINQFLALPTAAKVVVAPTADVDETLKAYQEKLAGLGYHNVGAFDGKMGGSTAGAIAAFYTDRHITAQPLANAALYSEIDRAEAEGWHRPVAPDRAYVTADQLSAIVPSVKANKSASFWSKVTAWFSGGGGTILGVAQFMPTAHDQASSYLSMAQEWGLKIPVWLPMLAIGILAFILYKKCTEAQNAQVSDYQTGKLN